MAKSVLHPWVEARPPPLKGASKKAFCAFFLFCAVFSQRTPHESHSHTTRIHPVIYLTPATHYVKRTTLTTATELTSIDASSRGKLPEASPKGPGPTHIRALAGQRSNHKERTLVPQGLASRSPRLEIKNPDQKTKPRPYRSPKLDPCYAFLLITKLLALCIPTTGTPPVLAAAAVRAPRPGHTDRVSHPLSPPICKSLLPSCHNL